MRSAAAALGVSPRTLRYYEELGLLQPARSAGGHRLYTEADIETVQRVGRMQALGFSLGTIRRALRYRSYRDASGQYRMPLADLRALCAEARADAAAVRERIAALERELAAARREADGLDRDSAFLEARLAEREREERDRAT